MLQPEHSSERMGNTVQNPQRMKDGRAELIYIYIFCILIQTIVLLCAVRRA